MDALFKQRKEGAHAFYGGDEGRGGGDVDDFLGGSVGVGRWD